MLFRKQALLEGTGFLDDYTLGPAKYLDIDCPVLMGYVLRERLLGALLLGILATTYLGIAVVYLFFIWNGIAYGFFFTGSILRYEGKGLLLFMGSMFPQQFLLVPGFLVLAVECLKLSRVLYYPYEAGISYVASKKKRFFHIFVVMTGSLLVILGGCFLESYVNPAVWKWILQFF